MPELEEPVEAKMVAAAGTDLFLDDGELHPHALCLWH